MDLIDKFISKILIPITLRIPLLKRWMDKKAEIVENTDPDAIKVSDIAQFYGMSPYMAKKLCDLACRQQLYSKNEDGTYKLVEKDNS